MLLALLAMAGFVYVFNRLTGNLAVGVASVFVMASYMLVVGLVTERGIRRSETGGLG